VFGDTVYGVTVFFWGVCSDFGSKALIMMCRRRSVDDAGSLRTRWKLIVVAVVDFSDHR
jgi:hypothetical protein